MPNPGLFDGVLARGPVRAEVEDRAWLQAMLDVEAALARAQGSPHAAAIAGACQSELYDIARLGAEAALSANPVVALVGALRERVGAEAAGDVHRGATSQDILDSAAMLIANRALGPLLDDLRCAADAAATLAERHRATPMAGRTLLQQALPTTFGLKAAGWMTALDAAAARLDAVRRERLAVQLGGGAGTLAAFGDRGPELVAALARELGLAEPVLPWHTDRTRIAELASALGEAVRRRWQAGRRSRAAGPGRGRRGARGGRARPRRLIGHAAQAQPGRGDLGAGLRPRRPRSGGHAAGLDGRRARARRRRVAGRVAPAHRAAAPDRLGRGVAARRPRARRGRRRAHGAQPEGPGAQLPARGGGAAGRGARRPRPARPPRLAAAAKLAGHDAARDRRRDHRRHQPVGRERELRRHAAGHDRALAPLGGVERVGGDAVGLDPHELGQPLGEQRLRGGVEVRPHRPGRDRRRGDAGAAQLLVQALGVHEHEGLGGGVVDAPGQGLEARRRAEVDDRPAAPLHHRRHVAGIEVDDGLDQQPHLLELAGAVADREGLVDAEAGAVDQDLDRQPARGDGLGQPVPVSLLRQVGGHHLGPHAVGARQLVGEHPQPVLPPRHQREAVAALGQGPRERRADAGGRARDQRGRGGGGRRQSHDPDPTRGGAMDRSRLAPCRSRPPPPAGTRTPNSPGSSATGTARSGSGRRRRSPRPSHRPRRTRASGRCGPTSRRWPGWSSASTSSAR